MRHIKILFLTTAMIAILIGLCVIVWGTGRPAPKASIILLGYTNYTMSQPNTNVFVYPGRGSWIRARMLLTNEGTASISYGAWGSEPYGWADVKSTQGKTNGYLAPPFTGGTAILRPGQATTFSVTLPTNTLQWQCGIEIETSSVRERAIWRVLESKLSSRLPEIIFYPLRLLPNKGGPVSEVKSLSLIISNQTPEVAR